MNRKHINSGGKRHSLNHLKDFSFQLEQQATKDKPEIVYGIDVAFSWHCYTRSLIDGDVEIMRQGNEDRCFCTSRYEHSFRLPDIIRTLNTRHCRQTGKGNYFTVEVIDIEDESNNYEIYFNLKKQGKGKNLRLFVESAYVRHAPDPFRVKKKRIRFAILAHNVKHGKKIRP